MLPSGNGISNCPLYYEKLEGTFWGLETICRRGGGYGIGACSKKSGGSTTPRIARSLVLLLVVLWNQHKFQTFTIRLFALGDPQWRTTIQWLRRDQLKPVVLLLSVVQVPCKTKEYV